jgi:hypothetical protein
VVPGKAAGVVRQWSADGRWLFVRRRSPDTLPVVVDLVDVTTGARRPWKELWPPERTGVWDMGGVRPAPDGASYIYNYSSALGSLYLAEGLR